MNKRNQRPVETLSPADEARAIAEESGNNFHCKVISYLRDREWATLISPYYVDPITSKPRETDIVAEKVFSYPSYYAYPALRIRLFIECKYVPSNQTTVFWFDKRDMGGMMEWVHTYTPFDSGSTNVTAHHYFSPEDEVAKLAHSRKDGKNTKDNDDGDPIGRAINQCLHGYTKNMNVPSLLRPNRAVATVSYPVIVFSQFSSFYRTDVASRPTPRAMSENFRMEVNYALPDSAAHQYFLVDMLNFDEMNRSGQMNGFLASLELEADEACKRIAKRKEEDEQRDFRRRGGTQWEEID